MNAGAAREKAQGVTLIELVMAMVLLGLVAALIVPVVWYGRFGANPVPTAQATAIAQSTLEQGMVAPYDNPFSNPNPKPCNGTISTQSVGAFSLNISCTRSSFNGISTNDAEYLSVWVIGPSGADITLGAWRTKYSFGGGGGRNVP